MTTITQELYRYSHTIGIYSLQGRGFNNPVDLALGRNGVMYVLNRAGPEVAARMPYKRISMCTVDEEYLGEFSSGGTGDGQMMWPSSIALDRDGNVYISDEALQRISVFDSRGRFLARWGIKGSGKGEFDRPAGIAFDREENLLVVDGLNNRVQRFTKDGRYLGGWGRAGSGGGEFNIPWGIAIDHDGNVYVADWRNDRVQKFDTDGGHLATYGKPGQGDGEFRRPAGLCIDAEGSIYVADWGNERVQVLDPEGSFIVELRGESELSRWARDYFSANQREFEERQKADMEPELDLPAEDFLREQSASVEKLFWGPTAVKTDGEGRLYVADSCRHRIQIYQKRRS
jgi:DNA-binding beta-propeller fold protein YncE